MRRLFTPLPTVLSCNTILVEASAGIAEVTKSVTVFIGKNVAPPIACGLAARHLYDKLNKHERQSGWARTLKKRVKNNPNDIARAFFEEIERLEKDKE